MVLSIATIFLLVIILFYVIEKKRIYIRRRKQSKESASSVEDVEKIDTPPYTLDVTHFTNEVVYKITAKSLKFGDIDGDKITHVRFKNFNKEMYLDSSLEDLYTDEILPIDFELYVKMGKGDKFVTNYEVKSNNIWSNG